MKEKAPNYLINLVPKCEPTIRTRNNSIPTFNCRTDCFKCSFFPSALNDWFNLDLNIRNAESVSLFKSRLLSFICPVQRSIYNIFDPKGLKFLLNSVKAVCDNFKSMPDKKDLPLFGDSRFDENKEKLFWKQL